MASPRLAAQHPILTLAQTGGRDMKTQIPGNSLATRLDADLWSCGDETTMRPLLRTWVRRSPGALWR